MKNKKKKGRTLTVVLICVAAVIALYFAVSLLAAPVFYPGFYKRSEKVCTIPDLWRDFIPQGVTLTDSGKVLICGYSPGSEPSRIYRIDDGKAVKILLNKEDGSRYTGHAGGITAHGKYVYISNASKIFVLDASDIESAKDGDVLGFIGHFEVPCRSSFCSSGPDGLLVGEYHADGYETDASHEITTPDGSLHAAMIFLYAFSDEAEFGVLSDAPLRAYSVRDKVQGAAFAGSGKMALSCSGGLSSSGLHFYSVDGEPDAETRIGRYKLPIYILDSKRIAGSVKTPHMSEDIEYRNGEIYIGFEAGAKKYGAGLLPFSERNVRKYSPDN